MFIWLDLEMTGLDVERDVIVEVAALATSFDLEPLDEGIDVVVHQDARVLATMGDVVREMHTRSGLLNEIAASTVDLAAAGERVLAYIKAHCPNPATVPLCGNSIGVDRRFLSRQLPAIEAHLHYRSIDVSSLKELCRRWYPDQFRARPTKSEGHRALADVHASIAELQYYRKTILR